MTEKDKALISEARYVRTDHNYIDRLKNQAESEEARRELARLSHDAFVAEEIAFDCRDY